MLSNHSWNRYNNFEIIFSKQDGSLDCFHREIDFIGRVLEKYFCLKSIPTMKLKLTSNHIDKVVVPELSYGGIWKSVNVSKKQIM